MKLTKKQIEEIEKRIEKEHPIFEFEGIFRQVLHFRFLIDFMKSKKGKEAILEDIASQINEEDEKLKQQMAELKYEQQLDIQVKSLKTREVELDFLKR